MKAILIDARSGTVTEVEYDGLFQSISKWIGGNCRTFTTVRMYENHDTLFVDDEGLYNGADYGFRHSNYDNHLMGNGLLLGTDDGGESIDVQTPLEQVQKDVRFFLEDWIECRAYEALRNRGWDRR
tara:strand:- start:56 stop:433 length:378 start_codon:yes stop_codon:yes gene_type:complete